MSNLFLALAMFVAPQVPVLSSGVHSLTLQRAGGPPIHYALSIPPGYSPKARVPLVLALHFAGNPADASKAVIEIPVRPALSSPGASIVPPHAQGAGSWFTPASV